MPSSVRSLRVPLADGEVFALEAGDPARPLDVLFLHANGFNAGTYRQILEALGEGLHVLAFDQRGHGRTTLPADPEGRETWDGFADDLLALMDRLRIDRPIVLSGHSMGGTAALLAAARAPERVSRLALFDPVFLRPPGAPPQQPSGLVEGALRRRRRFESRQAALEAYVGRGAFKTWPREVIADYVEYGFKDVADGVELACAPEWEASNFAAQGTELWTPFDRLDVPLRILKAEIGSTCLVGPDHAKVVSRPDWSVEIVAGSTHFLPMERPQLVVEALTAAAA